MSQKQIDIIGAGAGGLATAYYLHKSNQNVKIRVWEKSKFPGGLASNFEAEGFEIEKFYHHLFKRDVALQQLIEDVGLKDQLMWKPAATGSYYFQKPYRLSSPIDLLKFKPLPFFGRIRLGLLALQARTVKKWEKLDDISAKEYILKYAGKKVWDIVWEPLFKGKFGKYADTISAAWLWSKLVDRGSSRNKSGFEYLGYLKVGLGGMFKKLVQELENAQHEVNLSYGVQKLEEDANGNIYKIHTDKGVFNTDLVVCATQTPDLVRMLPDTFSEYKNQLSKIDFLANVCLVLSLKKSLSEFYWTNVTDPEAPFVGIIEQTKWTGTANYKDNHIAYISTYVPAEDKRLKMSKEELLEYYTPYIQKIFPHFTEDIINYTFKWSASYAQPIVHTGYRHDVPEPQSPIDNLLLCTMAQIYPNDRQVSNGIEMAKKVVELINQKP